MKDFETEYRICMSKHIKQSSGERLRRLKERHGYGEKLLVEQGWWPVVGNFDDLHPEYEFVGADGNYYYLDWAYIHHPKPTVLESDSFSSHARDADRGTFSRGLNRQNEIVLSDWNILRFSIDKLKEDPILCQKTIERMFREWYGADSVGVETLDIYKREIIRLASQSASPITPAIVSLYLGKKMTFVQKQLHELVDAGYLEPASGDKRIRSYRLKK